MIPQIGDIWEISNKEFGLDDSQFLLMEHIDDPNFPTSAVFVGLYLDSGKYGECMFNEGNMHYWKKLA